MGVCVFVCVCVDVLSYTIYTPVKLYQSSAYTISHSLTVHHETFIMVWSVQPIHTSIYTIHPPVPPIPPQYPTFLSIHVPPTHPHPHITAATAPFCFCSFYTHKIYKCFWGYYFHLINLIYCIFICIILGFRQPNCVTVI